MVNWPGSKLFPLSRKLGAAIHFAAGPSVTNVGAAQFQQTEKSEIYLDWLKLREFKIKIGAMPPLLNAVINIP